MNQQLDLSFGGCTCVDEKGGCSFGDSCCSCDAGGPITHACPTGGGGGGSSGKGGEGGGGCGGCGSGKGGEGGGGSGGSGSGKGGEGGGGSSGCGSGKGGEGGGGSGGNGSGKGGEGGGGGGGNGSGKAGSEEKKKRVPAKPRFCVEKVRKILKKVLLELLDHCYGDILNNGLSQKAVSCVRKQVKELKFDPRYKYVCFITVAERARNHLPLITRTYWDPEQDAVACFSHRTCATMAVIQCFGVLCERCTKC